MTRLQEREAILQCQGGDLAGLEVLVELHQVAVLRTAYGVVGNSHLAEDVAQQVFVELFTAIRGFDSERPFAPGCTGSWSISASRSFVGASIETFSWMRPQPACLRAASRRHALSWRFLWRLDSTDLAATEGSRRYQSQADIFAEH